MPKIYSAFMAIAAILLCVPTVYSQSATDGEIIDADYYLARGFQSRVRELRVNEYESLAEVFDICGNLLWQGKYQDIASAGLTGMVIIRLKNDTRVRTLKTIL